MLQRFAIANVSMSPALRPGDFVIAVRRRSAPARGEVVVFEHEDRPGFHLVKRVIGLPGESVKIADGQVEIDGHHLDEPWTQSATPGAGSWTLGQREMFVLGDLRHASDGDSRQVGPIPSAPRYEVVARYWPSPTRIKAWETL